MDGQLVGQMDIWMKEWINEWMEHFLAKNKIMDICFKPKTRTKWDRQRGSAGDTLKNLSSLITC